LEPGNFPGFIFSHVVKKIFEIEVQRFNY